MTFNETILDEKLPKPKRKKFGFRILLFAVLLTAVAGYALYSHQKRKMREELIKQNALMDALQAEKEFQEARARAQADSMRLHVDSINQTLN